MPEPAHLGKDKADRSTGNDRVARMGNRPEPHEPDRTLVSRGGSFIGWVKGKMENRRVECVGVNQEGILLRLLTSYFSLLISHPTGAPPPVA